MIETISRRYVTSFWAYCATGQSRLWETLSITLKEERLRFIRRNSRYCCHSHPFRKVT